MNPPLYVPLSDENEYIDLFAKATPLEFQRFLDELISQNTARWSISYYLENRSAILMRYPQIVDENRFYHLGIDINVPCGTTLYTPFDSDVVISDYEEDERAKLIAEKKSLHQEYHSLKDEVREVEIIQRNVEDIMREESRETQHTRAQDLSR